MGHIVQAVTVRWYNACAYYAVTLARGLDELGYRVTLAGARGTPSVEKARGYGIDTADVPDGGFLGRMMFCRRFALDNGVTLVNAHDGGTHLLWTLALRGTGIPVVRTSGNQVPPKNHAGARLLVRKTAGIIASCGTVRGYYADRFGIDRERIPVINGGVDTGFFTIRRRRDELRAAFGLPGDAFVFGILARFSPDKGHEHFFRAAGRVAERHPGVRFLVAGWKAQRSEPEIRAMADGAGVLDRTYFTGRHDDSRDLIEVLDAGVVTSVASETICRIAMEYMAMETPVVAFDTNVIPEVVSHGDTGYVVPAGDTDALADAMSSLVDSPEKVRTVGEAGRRRAETAFSLTAFAGRTAEAYRSFGYDAQNENP